MTLNQLLRREPLGNWSYGYFSLIDSKASDLTYTTITDHPYLDYVRMDNDHGPYQRVLFRQRVRLEWLIKPAQAEAAAPGQQKIAAPNPPTPTPTRTRNLIEILDQDQGNDRTTAS